MPDNGPDSDGAATELQQLAHLHRSFAENGGDLDRDVVNRLELLGGMRRLGTFAFRRRLIRRHFVELEIFIGHG